MDPTEALKILSRLNIASSAGLDEDVLKQFSVGEFRSLIHRYQYMVQFNPSITFHELMLSSKLKSITKLFY